MPSIIGSSSRPLLVADAPCTVCWYSGRKLIAPNIAKPSRKPIAETSAKLRLRNSPSDRIGSAARRSTKPNAISDATPSTSQAEDLPEPHAYSLPPQVVIRTSAVMPTESRPAPSQSMRCSVRCLGRCSG